jgi:hypothetical protein
LALIALASFSLLAVAPVTSAQTCQPAPAGAATVCYGDYAYTIGDNCQNDSIHEEGTGVNATTAAGYVQAGGYSYCNVFGGYSYFEQGVRARADVHPVFLELSWNKWQFYSPDGSNDQSGCSTWIYYVGPVLGYFNNVGCPAGDPPAEAWGHLLS